MKNLFVILGIVLSSLLVTGCEKKPAPEQVVPAGQKAIMQLWTAREASTLEALVREFVSAVKINGLKIDVMAFESDEILQETLVHAMAEGTGPDIVFTDGDWISNNTRKLVPFTQEPGFSINEFGSAFVRTASELLIQDSDIYGMPLAVDTLVVVYNEEYLIDRLENRNQPGRTWSEFQKDVEALTQQDNSVTRFARAGVAMGRVDNIHNGVDILENIMVQYGTPFFSEDGTKATFASTNGVNSEGRRQNTGVESLKFFTSFADKQYKNFSWNEYLASAEEKTKEYMTFVKGDVAMVFAYPKDFQTIMTLADTVKGAISEKNIYTAMFPQVLDPDNATSRVVLGNLFAGAVPRTTKFPDLAWRVLKFFSKKDIQAGFYESTGIPTAHLDLILEQSADPKTGIFARQAKFARANVIPVDKALLLQELTAVVQKVNDGESSEQVLQTLETKMSQRREAALVREKMINREE